MTPGTALFITSMALGIALLVVMFWRDCWASHRGIVILQAFLLGEGVLLALASPSLYRHLWPTLDKLNLILILTYARLCCEDFPQVSILLALCAVLKLCAWADVDTDSAYVPNLYHYFRIYADLAATVLFIVAIYRRKGEPDARARTARRSYRAEPATATTSAT